MSCTVLLDFLVLLVLLCYIFVVGFYSWEPPSNPNLIFEGFPLFDITWGYLDWIEKVHEITNIYDNYVWVIKCDYMQPKLTAYIPLDSSFIEGFGPYRNEHSKPPYTTHDYIHWNPRSKKPTTNI